MGKIKITSNPYKKETSFRKWNEAENSWVTIDVDHNENSRLLSKEYTEGFFPFRVKDIVDSLVKEYGVPGETLEILFEGSDEEFRELNTVCAEECYGGTVMAEKSPFYLENARDILPEVKRLFQEMRPLILSGDLEKIKRELNRFADASSDAVPVCVMGNYSTGKSTFINALVGSEILPSGIEPITAKIYKISRSEYEDRAKISFRHLQEDISITFTDTESVFDNNKLYESELSAKLKSVLSAAKEESIVSRVNKTLHVINSFENDKKESVISDVIEVSVPFASGVLAATKHPFVIFDTPGSNSASNSKHLEVLKTAMENMTNGLPIFLCTPDSLDSTDNEALYQIIHNMEELDDRFTMIVVNKADMIKDKDLSALPEQENKTLSLAVPRHLYSGGLFYVSSVMGLGAKIKGDFMDDSYAETYDDNESKFSDPSAKRYKTLYSYNIMPEQIKKKSKDLSSAQTDLVYSNSGLFAVENEIESFAGKYAAYNKCFQSQMYLRQVIDITDKAIAEDRNYMNDIRENINKHLEENKKALVDKLNDAAGKEKTGFVDGYDAGMAEYMPGEDESITEEKLREIEERFTKEHEEEISFDDTVEETRKAYESLKDDLKNDFISAISDNGVDKWKKMFGSLSENYKEAREHKQEEKAARDAADKKAADSLLKYVSDEFRTNMTAVHNELDEKSRQYWTANTERLREILERIVTGSDVLTDERREELKHIIINYQQISFRDSIVETIFGRENFERKILLGGQVLWHSEHLNLSKLAETYQSSMAANIQQSYTSIKESHQESAAVWIENLLGEITGNIVKYSPELSKQADQVRMMNRKIEECEDRRAKLQQYTQVLQQMMDWKIRAGETAQAEE